MWVRYSRSRRPGHPDIAEATLLLQLVGLRQALGVREDPLLHPGEEHDPELEALGGVQRHERHARAVVGDVCSGYESGGLEKRLEVGVLGRHVQELGQVLDAALGFDRTAPADRYLGLEQVAVAGPREDRRDQPVRRVGEEIPGAQLGEQAEEAPDACQGLPRRAGLFGAAERFGKVDPLLAGEVHQARLGRVADAASRRVEDAPQRHLVAGVGDGAQVGEHVAHLAPVEEAGPADHGVGDPTIGQGGLQRAALGVGPVEDCDVAIADVLVPVQGRDLARHEIGLVPVVSGPVAPDPVALAARAPDSSFSWRNRLLPMTALAASRIVWLER